MHFTFKTHLKVLIFKCDGICHCSHTDVQPSCTSLFSECWQKFVMMMIWSPNMLWFGCPHQASSLQQEANQLHQKAHAG